MDCGVSQSVSQWVSVSGLSNVSVVCVFQRVGYAGGFCHLFQHLVGLTNGK